MKISSLSIPTDKLRPLLDAIQEDHPQWDGNSWSLASIFQKGRIDPKVKYARFYSPKKPFLVISYTWWFTSLRRLVDICDGKIREGCDRFHAPLHLGKTTWIDVLFVCQFGLDATPKSSKSIVELTAERYSAAYEHLVVLEKSLLTRAWCLAELAVTTSTPGIRITVVGEWVAVEAALTAWGGEGFFDRMEARQPGDVALVRAFAERRFGSAEAFDRAVRDVVVGKLKAATIYNQACDLFYGDHCFTEYLEITSADLHNNGMGRDEAAGRVLFEQAAALGHAEAEFQVGRCYEEGKGGLKNDLVEAARWYRRAANGGSALALSFLAKIFRRFKLSEKMDKAARLYSLAADQGDGFALYSLGEMLEKGEGVEKDAGRAVELYRLALLKLPGISSDGLNFLQRTYVTNNKKCVEGLRRLGVERGTDREAARLEAARLARLDAARRGGRTPALRMSLAIAGGPKWDRLAAELASAGRDAGLE